METLKSARSRNSSLISVLIRAGSNSADTLKMLQREIQAAGNIKDRHHQTDVIRTLNGLMARVRSREIPETGLALFHGSCI